MSNLDLDLFKIFTILLTYFASFAFTRAKPSKTKRLDNTRHTRINEWKSGVKDQMNV